MIEDTRCLWNMAFNRRLVVDMAFQGFRWLLLLFKGHEGDDGVDLESPLWNGGRLDQHSIAESDILLPLTLI